MAKTEKGRLLEQILGPYHRNQLSLAIAPLIRLASPWPWWGLLSTV